jgi:hypothetical protein
MMAASALLAFGPFGSAAMLLWGLAAAVPVIIHLWNKRRYREMRWAAMEYLLAAFKKNVRRIRIEQLLLLAVRVLILLLLALALADPVLSLFPRLSPSLVGKGRTHTVIVLDGSYSMDYRSGERTRFETAQELAAQLVEQAMQGDGFTLVVMSDSPRLVISQPAYDPGDVIEEIRGLRLPHGGANLPATAAEVQRILAAAQKDHPRLTESRVCFFTDLGRVTWSAVETADTAQRLRALAAQASLVLYELGQPAVENVALVGLDQAEAMVTAGRSVTLQAHAQNFGNEDRLGQAVEFYVDGRRVHEERIDIPAGGRATAACTFRVEAAGEQLVEARLPGDLLSVDNHRWLSLPAREAVRVLCVEGKSGAARYVALALEPTRSDRPRIRPLVVPESAILETDLADYDCVFICNVGRFGRDEAGVLHDYVSGGGGLVVFLGDQVQPESYNVELAGGLSNAAAGTPLASSASARRVLPARLEGIAVDPQYGFDPREYKHPIVSVFRGHERAGLLTTPVWRYYRLAAHENAEIALWFEKGDPAIVAETIGRGRSLLVATAASDDSVDRSQTPPQPWTVMASWPSFPPLVQEMLAWSVRGRYAGRNVAVGEAIQASVHAVSGELTLEIVRPDQQSERVRMNVEGAGSRWFYAATELSGAYEARYAPPLPERQVFAVNVDTRESDLARFDPAELPDVFDREDQPREDGTPLLASSGPRRELFRLLLYGVFVLLIVESFLAWRFGYSFS